MSIGVWFFSSQSNAGVSQDQGISQNNWLLCGLTVAISGDDPGDEIWGVSVLLTEILTDSDRVLVLLGSQEIANAQIPVVQKTCVTQVLMMIKRCNLEYSLRSLFSLGSFWSHFE